MPLPFNLAKVNSVQQTLILLACKLSVSLSIQEAFRKELPKSYHNPGEGVHKQMVTASISRGLYPYKATPTQAVDLNTEVCEKCLGYSAMNTLRSAHHRLYTFLQGFHLENYLLLTIK